MSARDRSAALAWFETQGPVTQRVLLESGLLLRRIERTQALRARARDIEHQIDHRPPRPTLGP